MATDLLIDDCDFETMEPSTKSPRARRPRRVVERELSAVAAPAQTEQPAELRVALRTRLESCRTGRALLGLTRWAVAITLVVAGYYAAAGISAGVELVRSSGQSTSTDATPVLAASSQK